MTYDLIDDPKYVHNHLSVSTCTPEKGPRRRVTHWGVYYRGRLLHPHLSTSTEAAQARSMYADHVPSTDGRWQLFTTPGKQPSPSNEHLRKAGI